MEKLTEITIFSFLFPRNRSLTEISKILKTWENWRSVRFFRCWSLVTAIWLKFLYFKNLENRRKLWFYAPGYYGFTEILIFLNLRKIDENYRCWSLVTTTLLKFGNFIKFRKIVENFDFDFSFLNPILLGNFLNFRKYRRKLKFFLPRNRDFN